MQRWNAPLINEVKISFRRSIGSWRLVVFFGDLRPARSSAGEFRDRGDLLYAFFWRIVLRYFNEERTILMNLEVGILRNQPSVEPIEVNLKNAEALIAAAGQIEK